MKIKLIGIDLAKNVFQVCALNQAGKVVFNRSVRRARLSQTIAQQEPTTIALESCASAHYWGRKFEELGHKVILVPPQHVKPFVRGGKNDARDALAICEAAQRPDLHLVPIKSVEQQDIQLLHRVRQRQVRQATALANQIRGISHEYGVSFPKGVTVLLRRVPDALEDGSNELSPVARATLWDLLEALKEARAQSARLENQIAQLARANPLFDPLQELPGFGPIVASAYLAAVGNGRQFKRGRQVGAWLGIVPRQHGTGGKIKLKGMTKQGDRYLRTQMIHGARAALSRSKAAPLREWADPIIARRGFNVATVALANKMARIAWVIVTTGEPFDWNKAFAPQ